MQLANYLKSETSAVHDEIDSHPVIKNLMAGKLTPSEEFKFYSMQARWLKQRLDLLVAIAEHNIGVLDEACEVPRLLRQIQSALSVMLTRLDQSINVGVQKSPGIQERLLINCATDKSAFLGKLYVVCGSLNGFLMIGSMLKKSGNREVALCVDSLNQGELRTIWSKIKHTLNASLGVSPELVRDAAVEEFRMYQQGFNGAQAKQVT